MIKIAVITDSHANLPALKAALQALRAEGYDAIYHTGDSIGIGPYPSESLDLLLGMPNMHFLMGNHETYFTNGMLKPPPSWMSPGEAEHHLWAHSLLDPNLRGILSRWPFIKEECFEGVTVSFLHYEQDAGGTDFKPILKNPSAVNLDNLYKERSSQIIFYGHNHDTSDIQGIARYVNPGSLGCQKQAVARYCVVEFNKGRYTVEHREISYDDRELFRAYEDRQVPERKFIYRVFLGGRFTR